MERRKLGSQGLDVACLGLGCMGMSFAYGPADDAESIATIHRALDLGVDFFDTAEMYGPFENEVLLGRALKGKRNQVVIATKFGFKLEGKTRTGMDGRPEHAKAVAEASLKRLGVDVIDLYYQHRLDKTVPIEETVGAMGELVREGKVRYIGLCEVGVQALRRAHKTHPITALQSEYSRWERNLEADLIPTLRELGIGLVPYSPLGRGFLTGTVQKADEYPPDDFRHNEQRFSGENFDRNMKLVDVVRGIAATHRATPAQIALAWVLAQGTDIVPIPGTKRRKYLEDNVKAAEVNLSAADLAALDAAAPAGATAGLRYGAVGMATIDR